MKTFSNASNLLPYRFPRKRKITLARRFVALCGVLITASALTDFFSSTARAQQTKSAKPVIVQPGAPGKPSIKLPSSTLAKLPPRSQAEIEFMQGMIMHHSQAVEMTSLITSHTENKDLRSLGARISSSQSDEIR